MSIGHGEAREVLVRAWRAEFTKPPSLAELQATQAIARLETYYGQWWDGPGADSHNWGRIICPSSVVASPCPPGTSSRCFFGHAQADLERVPVCYTRYPDDIEGARALLRALYVGKPSVVTAVNARDADAVAIALRKNRYFVGADYPYRLVEACKQIAKDIGEECTFKTAQPPPFRWKGLPEPSFPKRVAKAAATGGGLLAVGVGIAIGVAWLVDESPGRRERT